MIRVLSYPPRHSYVDRLHGVAAELVHRDEPAHLPRLSDPDWVGDHAGEWDVAHFHLDGALPELPRLEAVLDAHRDAGRATVWTVHHLRSGTGSAPSRHEATMELLADRVDAIVAPTLGSAAEIDRCFGRRPRVIPSGGILSPDAARRLRHLHRSSQRHRGAHVLLPAGGERDDLDLPGALAATRLVAATDGGLQVMVALEELPPGSSSGNDGTEGDAPVDEVVDGVRVTRHTPWSFDELCRAVAKADALLLPYRWCSHCALVELATDIGTPVLAGDVGHIGEQAPIVPIRSNGRGLDVDAAAAALRRVTRHELPGPVPLPSRAMDRRHFLTAHHRLYESLTL